MGLPFSVLAETWRDRAAELRAYGAEPQAVALERCASELEAAEREYLHEHLTVEDAADEAGVCRETIRRRVRRGELENVGDGHRIAVRRADLLPHTDSRPSLDGHQGEPDVAEELLRARY